jgi:hypothetical protein
MSFVDCILNNDRLNARQKEQLTQEYEKLVATLTEKYGSNAPLIGAQKYVGLKAAEITKKTDNTIRDALLWRGIDKRLKSAAADYARNKKQAGLFGRLWGKSSYAAASRSFLESVYTRQQALERRITLAIAQEIEAFRSKNAGITQDTEGFARVVEHLLGKESADAQTRAFAESIRAQFDNMHKMYTQAGGIMGRLTNYFPQSHNPVLVGRVSFQEWLDFITPKLDMSRMVDGVTGLPLNRAEFLEAMEAVYNGIRTNGLDEVAELAAKGGQRFGKGALATKRNLSRFLHFKDADSFLQYNAKFGTGEAGLFDAMMGHISTMTRDIAILQEMGPKPEATIARMQLGSMADGAWPQAKQTLQGMYDTLAGRNGYSGELPGWYRATSNLQHWLRSSLLGGAPVSALSDTFYAGFTARMNGLPVSRVIAEYGKLINPASDADRRIARRIAFVAGASNGSSIAQARFADDLGHGGTFAWLSNFTNRASGLAAMTDAVRQSIVLSTQGFFAEARALNMAFAELDPNMKAALKRWGMDENDYKIIIGSNPHAEEGGADFIRPEDVAQRAPETARKYEMWLTDMAQTASNEPRLLTRAITTGAVFGEARQGTGLRATASSVMMFKSFGITVVLNHLLPSLRHAASAQGADRLTRLLPMLIGTTVMGALAIQAKDVLYGKTTRTMDDPKFWMAAMTQGGGFGIFGDFLFSDSSRFNQNWQTTLLGPVFGFANDGFRVFQGNFSKALEEDEETKFMADFSQFASRYIPAVKLWYTRLLLERTVLDQVQRMADPLYDTRMSRIESKMMREKEQEFWWAPGERLPQ